MKKILVPTDFSTQAANALHTAAQLAQKFNAEIYVLHVLDLPLHLTTTAGDNYNPPETLFFLKLAKQQFNTFLDKPYLKNLKVFDEIEVGNIYYGIEEAIKKFNIDFVVMGSSGSSGLQEFLIGSNTEKVVRHIKLPVLVIKNNIENFEINNITHACDFAEESIKSFTKAVNFANTFNAKLHILYVNTPNDFKTTREIEATIDQFLSEVTPEVYDVTIYNDDTVEQGILNFCRSNNTDVISVSTHGRKGIAHFFNGSISEDLVNHALRPVIAFNI
ncbi:universal stress protein [Zhouia sp. PK063]|uniref:universal stress protein n=1 Tax=Zhouia sp. PK063 TaxID=3373602 RepID=UPI0037BB2ED1